MAKWKKLGLTFSYTGNILQVVNHLQISKIGFSKFLILSSSFIPWKIISLTFSVPIYQYRKWLLFHQRNENTVKRTFEVNKPYIYKNMISRERITNFFDVPTMITYTEKNENLSRNQIREESQKQPIFQQLLKYKTREKVGSLTTCFTEMGLL